MCVVGTTLYVVGGKTDEQRATPSVYKWDRESSEPGWQRVADLPEARQGCAVAEVGDKVYVFGGDGENNDPLQTVVQYDPQKNHWTRLDPTHLVPSRHRSACFVLGERIFMAGGRSCGEPDHTVVSFDPATKSFTWVPTMDSARWGAIAVVFQGKQTCLFEQALAARPTRKDE